MEVIQLFATQIKLVSQRVKEARCYKQLGTRHCKNRRGSINVCWLCWTESLIYCEAPRGQKHEHMYNSASMWLSDQEAPYQSLCSDTNLASASLWLLFKLAYTQGSTLPVNIKSWHNCLKQTQQDMRKITCEMNVRGSFGFNCHSFNLWHFWPDDKSNKFVKDDTTN